jgi:hypothetical protein
VSSVLLPHRPRPVIWAGVLLILAAVLIFIDGCGGALPIGAYGEATNDAYLNAGVADSARLGEAVQADILVALAIDVLFAVAFLALGLHRVLNLGGRSAARIATWVLAGVGVLCFGYGTFGPASGSLVTRMSGLSTAGSDPGTIARQIADHTPGWVTPFQTTLAVAIPLVLIAVILLLALPSSSAYLRARRASAMPA